MNKFYRVYSDSFAGHVFTEKAYNVLKTQIGNGDPQFHEVKEISVVEVGNEKIYDVADLPDLGYMTTPQEEEEVQLTEQSDDDFFSTVSDDDNLFGDDDEEDEYY